MAITLRVFLDAPGLPDKPPPADVLVVRPRVERVQVPLPLPPLLRAQPVVAGGPAAGLTRGDLLAVLAHEAGGELAAVRQPRAAVGADLVVEQNLDVAVVVDAFVAAAAAVVDAAHSLRDVVATAVHCILSTLLFVGVAVAAVAAATVVAVLVALARLSLLLLLTTLQLLIAVVTVIVATAAAAAAAAAGVAVARAPVCIAGPCRLGPASPPGCWCPARCRCGTT